MNAPAAIASASDIVAVVERARALLDEGDVMAARVLAAGAYDQAKAAAGFASRFGAAEKLVAKARSMQADALLIEAQAKIRLADDWDVAQAAGKVGQRTGRPKKVVEDIDDIRPPTAAEVGLSRQEIHEARKLRDAEREAPGIVERAIQARLEAGLEPSRASLRANIGTKTATREERGHNLYETPVEAMRTLLALERFSLHVLEPACGKTHIGSACINRSTRRRRQYQFAGREFPVGSGDLQSAARASGQGNDQCSGHGWFGSLGDSHGRG